MNKTAIEYLTHVWNSVTGCSPVSAGCEHCWAKRQHERFSKEPFSKVTLHPDRLEDPLRRRKPARIGVCFSGDLFHEMVPISFIAKVFNVMRNAEGHQFLLLTKRPQRMAVILGIWKCKGNNFGWVEEPLPNVWPGVSVENQATADERIPWLLKTPAAHRWVSYEPAIGPVDMSKFMRCTTCGPHRRGWANDTGVNGPVCSSCDGYPERGIDWLVMGGEGGPGARPCDLAWLQSVVEQCKSASVPCYVKQIHLNGRLSKKLEEWPNDLRVREFPETHNWIAERGERP